MEPNYYSEGETRAYLSPDQIKASWYQGDHRGARRDCLNEAFRLYYIYRNRIEQVARRHWDTYWAMLRELEDAGDAGWGPGVSDLDDASRHLIAQNDHWTDGAVKAYWGLNRPSVYENEVYDAPLAAANFLSALNRKLKRLEELQTEFQQIARSLEDDLAKAKKLCKIIRQAIPLAWLGPVDPNVTQAESGWYEQMLPWLDNFNSAMEVIEVLREADLIRIPASVRAVWKGADWFVLRPDAVLQTYSSAKRAGMDESLARAWGALALLITFLPVLDNFYGTIIQQSPALIHGMTSASRKGMGSSSAPRPVPRFAPGASASLSSVAAIPPGGPGIRSGRSSAPPRARRSAGPGGTGARDCAPCVRAAPDKW
jgi:hypothetical protein